VFVFYTHKRFLIANFLVLNVYAVFQRVTFVFSVLYKCSYLLTFPRKKLREVAGKDGVIFIVTYFSSANGV